MLGAIASHYVAGGGLSAYATEVTADTPLVWYRRGESAGPSAVDSSGNGRHGTYAGSPTFGVAGLINNDTDTAVNQVGFASAQGSRTPNAAWMQLTQFTIEAWVKLTSKTGNGGTSYNIIAARSAIFNGAGSADSWVLGVIGDQWRFVKTSGSSPSTVIATGTPALATRYHVVVTVDGPAQTYKLRVNNSLLQTATSVGSLNTGTQDLTVGMCDGQGWSPSTNFHRFDGIIDEVALYSGVLADARIAAHYTAGTS